MAGLTRTSRRLLLMGAIPAVLLIFGLVAWRLLTTDTEAAEPVNDYWVGEYFSLTSGSGQDQKSSSTSQSRPILVRNDNEINFDWGKGSPGVGVPSDQFSARWTRTVPFDRSIYRFHVMSDDGIRLYVDEELKLDRWYDNRGTEQTVDVALSAGSHKLRVEYYENWGDALARVWWEQIPEAAPTTAAARTSTPAPPPSPSSNQAGADPTAGSTADGSAQVTTLSADTGTAIPAGNLLVNGGFELGSDDDRLPDGWGVSIPDSQFGVSDGQAGTPEGQRVAVFPPSMKSFLVTQEVEARQNESCEFSGWVGIPSAGGWFRLTLTVIPLNDQGQPLASYDQASYTQPTDGWVQVKNRVAMPTYTTRARVQIKADVMRATAYLDDLSLEHSGS
ncbi:MAG: PA14 domain-containing protein [Chloroflexota bacterium]